MPKIPVRTLIDRFQVFNVLDDGDTFSGADGSQIMVYPNDDKMNEDALAELENGDLPNEGEVATICLRKLLNEAMEAKLECVKPLLDLIKKK
jgi:hypothetical protein